MARRSGRFSFDAHRPERDMDYPNSDHGGLPRFANFVETVTG